MVVRTATIEQRITLRMFPRASQRLGSACFSKKLGRSASTSSIETPRGLVSWEYNLENKLGVLTLNSPSTLNALTVEMGKEFKLLVSRVEEQLTSDLNVNAIILTAAGDKSFSAGGNFHWLRGLKDNHVTFNADAMLSFYKSFLCIRHLPVPIVAALKGPAVGAGAGLALACDMRVSCKGPARLGLNFTRLGIHSGMGTSHFLEVALGGRSALLNELLLTGKMLDGEEAKEFGLLNRLVDDKALVMDEAITLASQAAQQNPFAVRSMTQTLRRKQDIGLETALQREAYAQALCYSRGDWGEGLDAVIERRDPSFDSYHQDGKE